MLTTASAIVASPGALAGAVFGGGSGSTLLGAVPFNYDGSPLRFSSTLELYNRTGQPQGASLQLAVDGTAWAAPSVDVSVPYLTKVAVPLEDAVNSLPLPTGQHTLQVYASSAGLNMDFLGGSLFAARFDPYSDTPSAHPQSVNVAHDAAKAITLTGADPNVPVQSLSFAIAANPTHGTLSGLNPATGTVTYTPSSNFAGTDSFTFTVTNTSGLTSAPATVSLSVAAAAPTGNGQSVAVGHNTAKPITLTGTDPNLPAQSLTFAIATNPAHGKLSGLNPSTGAVTYTPDNNFAGSDSFIFTVTNASGLTSSAAVVSLAVGGGQPTANGQTLNVSHSTSTAITLTGSDPNVPAQALTFAIAANPTHGTLTGFNAATGAVTYTPNANFAGPDSFAFTVTNTSGLSSGAATVTLNVTAPPTFTVAEFPGSGVWRFTDSAGWEHLTPADASSVAVDVNGDVVAEFLSQGVWFYNSSVWQKITPADATQVAIGGSGIVVANFQGWGIGQYTIGAGWRLLTPAQTSVFDVDPNGDVVADFRGAGVWLYTVGSSSSSWRQITPGEASQVSIAGSGIVVAEFPGWGIGRYTAATGWQLLTVGQASSLAVDANGDVVAGFKGAGVWLYTVGGSSPGWRQITIGEASQVSISATGTVAAEFQGWGIGLYTDSTGWQHLRAVDATLIGAAR